MDGAVDDTCTVDVRHMISEVMRDFPWEFVHAGMTAVKWQWRNEGVPTVQQLKKEARELLRSVIEFAGDETERTSVSSGGLTASYESKQLKLEFILGMSSYDGNSI
jgi:hypothetical protein